MRNMTITIDDATAEWARVLSAKNQTSVSNIVGDMLTERKQREEGYTLAMESYLDAAAMPLSETVGTSDRPYPARDSLHER
ncbi:MAG: CopG family transcriptional regulator [Acidiferrobacter sp.]